MLDRSLVGQCLSTAEDAAIAFAPAADYCGLKRKLSHLVAFDEGGHTFGKPQYGSIGLEPKVRLRNVGHFANPYLTAA